jgi:hypothetical protein
MTEWKPGYFRLKSLIDEVTTWIVRIESRHDHESREALCATGLADLHQRSFAYE